MYKDGGFEVTREIDGGLQTVGLNTPCVITCDLRLNEPRFASIPQIMQAKKKPTETINLTSLKLGDFGKLEILDTKEPSQRQGGVIVKTVDELIEKLRGEAKVL